MKKFFTLIALAAMTLMAQAQTPNRVLVREASGNIKGFLTERVDSIYFGTVNGRVAADVTVNSFDADNNTVYVAVAKTAACQYYRLCLLNTNTANMITSDAAAASYVEYYGSSSFYDDYTNAALTDESFTFVANTSYTILTVGYDEYGCACEASRAEFTTPKAALVGNPTVTYTIDDIQNKSFTMTFTPNADVAGYAFCCFPKGQLQQQFETFGAMFGYASIGDMVKAWGIPSTEAQTYTYNNMDPGMEYDVAIQAWDVNGNYADLVIANVKTKALGGEGKSLITITIGDAKMQEGQFTQRVTFEPNDQTNFYRAMLVTKEAFDKNGQQAYVEDYLMTDQNVVDWNITGTDDSYWELDPSTAYYALAIGQNALGEWGDLCKVEFTTPATAAAAPAAHVALPKRIAQPAKTQKGVAPKLMVKKSIQLVEK